MSARTVRTTCGQYPAARGYRAVCQVCTALERVDQQAPGALASMNAIFDRLERIKRIKVAYRRRRGRRRP